MAQLRADSELLRTMGVMDYSLLLGIHFPAKVRAQGCARHSACETTTMTPSAASCLPHHTRVSSACC
jgi:hypothetical protein